MADSTESTAHPVKKLKQLIIESEVKRLLHMKQLKGNIPSRAKKDYKEMRSYYWEEPDADLFWEELSLEPTPVKSSHDTSLRHRDHMKHLKQRIIESEESKFLHMKQLKQNIPPRAKDYTEMTSDYWEESDADSLWEERLLEPTHVESSHDTSLRQRDHMKHLKQRITESGESKFLHMKQLKQNIPSRAKDYIEMISDYCEVPEPVSFWEKMSLQPTPLEPSHDTSLGERENLTKLKQSITEGEENRFSHIKKQLRGNIPSREKKDYKGGGTRRSACQQEDKTGTKHGQQQERNENKDLANDQDRRTCRSLADECGRYSVSYEIRINLADAATLKASRSVKDYPLSDTASTESKIEQTIENRGDTIQPSIFSRNWDDRLCFSAGGAKLRRQGSDVLLQVPLGAVQEETNVTVYAAVCGNEAHIKHKLQLSATETVVSPLAEFWAGSDFRFQKHVDVTLPTCLSSDYNVNLLHVYCVTGEGSDGQMIFSDLQRLDRLSQTADKETPGAYFYIHETRQVHVMTTHFSGYVCTYCGFCQDIGVDVYASQKYENGSIHVAILVLLWDKLSVSDFQTDYLERNLYRLVWRSNFFLQKMFKPAELQVDLKVSDEQASVWQNITFSGTPQKKQSFPLMWDEVDCKKCSSDKPVKYTTLGPFDATWMFKSQSLQTPSTMDVRLIVSHLQTQGNLEPHSSDKCFHINVQPCTEDENCHANGHQERACVVNINKVNGDVYFAKK